MVKNTESGHEMVVSEHSREVIALESHFVSVINIGNPELKVDLNKDELQRFIKSIDTVHLSNNLTVIFDNRSFPKAIKDMLSSVVRRKDVVNVATAIMRSLGVQASTIENHTVYINTQEVAFYESIGVQSLNKILRHELAHARQDQTKIDSSPKVLAESLTLFLTDIITGGVMGTELAYIYFDLINKIPQSSFVNMGVFLLAFGAGRLVKKKLYRNKAHEVDARQVEKEHRDINLTDHRTQTLTERSSRKAFSKITKMLRRKRG